MRILLLIIFLKRRLHLMLRSCLRMNIMLRNNLLSMFRRLRLYIKLSNKLLSLFWWLGVEETILKCKRNIIIKHIIRYFWFLTISIFFLKAKSTNTSITLRIDSKIIISWASSTSYSIISISIRIASSWTTIKTLIFIDIFTRTWWTRSSRWISKNNIWESELIKISAGRKL